MNRYIVKRKLYLKLDKLKLQLLISLLQRDALSAKKFLSILCAQQISKLDESLLFQLFQCKKARWTNSMASKTQTQKKKEDSLLLILPQESEEADSVISIVNYSGNCRNQRFDRPSFPVCKENRWAAISPSLPNYSKRGREGKKGEKEARAALTRSNSARKHRRNHLRPPCLFNSAGRRRFVCARHTKFQPGERTHTNAFTRFSELW